MTQNIIQGHPHRLVAHLFFCNIISNVHLQGSTSHGGTHNTFTANIYLFLSKPSKILVSLQVNKRLSVLTLFQARNGLRKQPFLAVGVHAIISRNQFWEPLEGLHRLQLITKLLKKFGLRVTFHESLMRPKKKEFIDAGKGHGVREKVELEVQDPDSLPIVPIDEEDVKHTSIRVLLAMVTLYDLKLEQLDVKIAFLHGELEEQIFIRQSEGFVIQDKEDHV
ncbi:hypothetical protein RJ639_031561 [Escallonia herrerae]|uniref:Reverse transcriptase Ty1/copia-type domain-containing protein n=1 Tax=Escallonia herrerae TaxID=1293975 RepID=A0AA88WYM7_9ASTE|nr:hypothetical protein RJ639_031561 [Escallonia herrerae]